MPMQIIVTFSELTNVKPSQTDLNEIVAKFEKESTFHFLTTINTYLSLFPANVNEEDFVYIQRFLSKHLLEEELYELTNVKLKEVTPLERPIFHRWQLLFLMKKVLLESPFDGELVPREEGNKEARYLLGKACLIVNDFYVIQEQEEKVKSENILAAGEADRVAGEFLAQMLPTSELDNPTELHIALPRIVSYLEIFETAFPNFIDNKSLSKYFKSLSGISLEIFIEMVVSIHAYFLTQKIEDLTKDPRNFNLNKNIFFSTLNYSDAQVDKFFELILSDYEHLLEALKKFQGSNLNPHYDFRGFRTYPLISLGRNSLTIIDMGFFTEKLLFGLYHTIFNTLPPDKKIRRLFSDHWGKVFEIYINGIFEEIYPTSPLSKRFFPEGFFEGKRERKSFDGIIEYPNALIVMEYKGGSLNANAKYSGDREILLDDMDQKFGRRDSGSGVRQLATKIEVLFHAEPQKRLKIRNLEFGNKKIIYPILMVNETSLELSLSHLQLRNWFKIEKDARQISTDLLVQPLIILTVGDLEVLTPYLTNDFSLMDFLEFYINSFDQDWFHPLAHPDNIPKNFMYMLSKFRKSKKIDFRPNLKTLSIAETIFDKITENLKL